MLVTLSAAPGRSSSESFGGRRLEAMKILVIRFRQMGDAVLATALLNSIRRSFPDAEIHFVLNSQLADLFAGHPSVDRVISFTPEVRHSPLRYLWKILKLMASERYDAVIDMRSTPNCLPFSLFAPFARLRVGLRKGYTRFVMNRRIPVGDASVDVVTHNLRFLEPLAVFGPVSPTRDFSLSVTPDELTNYSHYLQSEGIDLARPILLCGVVSKLAHKSWPMDNMRKVMEAVVREFPQWQIVFNYAPGYEEEAARRLYADLGSPASIYINVRASSMRALVALASLSTAYFGNEGGARHIAQAVGTPSLVIVSPDVRKSNWIISNSVEALAIAAADALAASSPSSPDTTVGPRLASMSYEARYALITPDLVLSRLPPFLLRHSSL